MASVNISTDRPSTAARFIQSTPTQVRTEVSWEQDLAGRIGPGLFTSLLRESVPVLDYADWRITDTQDGSASSLLPLNYESTNQHGTHQATLMTLAADYTGGAALATVLRGVPIVGVHPVPSEDSALLWLLNINMDYKVPSTADLVISCSVPDELRETIRERFWTGEKGVYPLEVTFSSNGESVAKAQMTYFLQHAAHIRPQSATARLPGLYRHKIKSSARLVAGVRAMENTADSPRYRDDYSAIVAGKHGALLAERFTQILPVLREMIAARTKHADDCLRQALADGVEQVVSVGVGLDCRALRFAHDSPETRYFELDLPDMLIERERALGKIEQPPELKRTSIPINLEFEDLAQVLAERGDFAPGRPTFVIFEGGSMYFERELVQRIFTSMRGLLSNPKSRLWTDIVAREVADRTSSIPEVISFVKRLDKLGESFEFGHDEPARFLAELELEAVSVDESGLYQPERSNPMFDLYRFVLLRA